MAGERRHDEALKPGMGALDAELARLLDVAPSDEFEARVRQRVRRESGRVPWGRIWELAVAGALVAVVAAALMFRTVRREPASPSVGPEPVQARTGETPKPPPYDSGPQQEPAVHNAAKVRSAPAPRRRVADATNEPAVIVDEAQRAAFRRLIVMTASGRLDERLAPTITMDPIEIPPILVDLLEKTRER